MRSQSSPAPQSCLHFRLQKKGPRPRGWGFGGVGLGRFGAGRRRGVLPRRDDLTHVVSVHDYRPCISSERRQGLQPEISLIGAHL